MKMCSSMSHSSVPVFHCQILYCGDFVGFGVSPHDGSGLPRSKAGERVGGEDRHVMLSDIALFHVQRCPHSPQNSTKARLSMSNMSLIADAICHNALAIHHDIGFCIGHLPISKMYNYPHSIHLRASR